MSNNGKINTIIDKIRITGKLQLLTGMHIGSSNDFAPIGAVDSVIVRNPLDNTPIIPGSSIKGKIRTLLARTENDSHILNIISKDKDYIKRLFGSSEPDIVHARLQFFDLFMNKENKELLEKKNTDLYLTEIKFENTINRLTAVANPRQIERVPAGTIFDFNLIYNVEDNSQVEDDFNNLSKAFKLLQMDYIGGSGTRGYGKIAFTELNTKFMNLTDKKISVSKETLDNILSEVKNYALLPV